MAGEYLPSCGKVTVQVSVSLAAGM